MTTQNDLEDMLARVLKEVKDEYGKVVLAEIQRRTGLSRQRLRRWQRNGYTLHSGKKRGRPEYESKLDGYKEIIDDLMRKGIRNSSRCFSAVRDQGYAGGITIVKDYILKHKDLIPAKRQIIDSKGNRGRRYYTAPGDCFQMDWGFVKVVDTMGREWQAACFAMVCHHCGSRYVEFFPNAKQENLFIGMLHAFMVMGVPRRVLTDNMKSVRDGTDAMGKPIFNKTYDDFQHLLDFNTDLCKVAHPFTKGKVERLVRYVKDNFINGRTFLNVTELNTEALKWCIEKNKNPIAGYDFIPAEEHRSNESFRSLPEAIKLLPYLAPMRKISFDGFVNYEGRLYGVPLSYKNKTVRVSRVSEELRIVDPESGIIIQRHRMDWSKRAKFAPHQWDEQQEEKPTAPVKVSMAMRVASNEARFARFSFDYAEAKEADNGR